MDLLPHEVWYTIFTFLDATGLAKVSRVCKMWLDLASQNSLWRGVYLDRKKKRILLAKDIPYKLAYKNKFYVRKNWIKGRCKVLELRGHTSEVRCVDFQDKFIISSGNDKSIRFWSIEERKCVGIIDDAHTQQIPCVQITDGGDFISSCVDGKIKLWDTSTQGDKTKNSFKNIVS